MYTSAVIIGCSPLFEREYMYLSMCIINTHDGDNIPVLTSAVIIALVVHYY